MSNAPSEAANNLLKRVKRVASGSTRLRNYRIRVLLYAGQPNWDLLATSTPRCNAKSRPRWVNPLEREILRRLAHKTY